MAKGARGASAATISVALGTLLGCAAGANAYLRVDQPLAEAEAEPRLAAARAAADDATALAQWRVLIRGGVQTPETLVGGARAAAACALARPGGDPEREPLAREATAWAEAALARGATGAPALYAHALALGLLAESSALAVAPRDVLAAALRVVAADPGFEQAAGHRMAGLYYLRAPDLYGGDLDQALEHLGRAVALAPGHAENHAALAEARLEDDDAEGARAALDAAERLPRDARVAAWIADLRARAR
jgi:hypothetical protein